MDILLLKYKMEPVINEYFSCHQGLLATYASYQKRDYYMMFSESWGFGYKKDDKPFGISLYPDCQGRRNTLLDKFHGIRIENIKYSGMENLLEQIEAILQYSPIILYCDVFDCPWNIAYNRHHIDHYVLITGIEHNSKQVNILDPYSTKDENIIEIEQIASYSGEISTFITNPMHSLTNEDYLFEITNSYNYIKNSDFMQSLESFRNDFQVRFEEVLNIEYIDEYAIPLIINLRRIANQRYCYCIFLKQMIDKKLIDSSILAIMESIADKYSLLRILLIRQILKKKSSTENINMINEIVNKEYEAYEKMKLFI